MPIRCRISWNAPASWSEPRPRRLVHRGSFPSPPFRAERQGPLVTLAMLPLAVLRARQHDLRRHQRAMTGLFVGALVIAGVFTLLPGRITHAVFFGPVAASPPLRLNGGPGLQEAPR